MKVHDNRSQGRFLVQKWAFPQFVTSRKRKRHLKCPNHQNKKTLFILVLIQVPLFYFYPPKDRLRLVFCKVVSSLYVILRSRDLYHWLAPVSPVSERCYMPRSRFKTRPTSCILKSGFCLPTLSPGVSKMLYKQPKISIVLFLSGRRHVNYVYSILQFCRLHVVLRCAISYLVGIIVRK